LRFHLSLLEKIIFIREDRIIESDPYPIAFARVERAQALEPITAKILHDLALPLNYRRV